MVSSDAENLAFTRDPEWIAQREKLWKRVENQVAEGLSRKVYNRWKTFFFTGEMIGEGRLDQGGLLEFYPKFDLEGMQAFLLDPPFLPVTDSDYQTIQSLFAINVDRTPGVTLEQAVAYFTHVFGERYDPHRRFPFDIAGEADRRSITLHQNLMFAYGTTIYNAINNPRREVSHWFKLLDYFFSLFPYVERRFFDVEKTEIRENIQGGVRLSKIQSRFRKMLQWAFDPSAVVANHPHREIVLTYLEDFRSRMDNMENYPGQLEELWVSIKKEYA